MKTPISYYGGKQNMITEILPLIPEHRIYCEPFFGGGAIFFAKPQAEAEIINDTNSEVINFFSTVKNNSNALQAMLENTIYSREEHTKAMIIMEYSFCFTSLERAWAFFLLSNMSFANKLNGSWGYGLNITDTRIGTKAGSFYNKVENLKTAVKGRFNNVDIENIDAVYLIKQRDREEMFFYIDPPYVGSQQGHYSGYGQEDFDKLLDVLKDIKGRFLLSSYKNDALTKAIKKNNWKSKEIEKVLCAGISKGTEKKKKTEVLTWNYK